MKNHTAPMMPHTKPPLYRKPKIASKCSPLATHTQGTQTYIIFTNTRTHTDPHENTHMHNHKNKQTAAGSYYQTGRTDHTHEHSGASQGPRHSLCWRWQCFGWFREHSGGRAAGGHNHGGEEEGDANDAVHQQPARKGTLTCGTWAMGGTRTQRYNSGRGEGEGRKETASIGHGTIRVMPHFPRRPARSWRWTRRSCMR